MFWCFGREACGILAPQPGIGPARPALEGEGFSTGPPGTSLAWKAASGLVCFIPSTGHRAWHMDLLIKCVLHEQANKEGGRSGMKV